MKGRAGKKWMEKKEIEGGRNNCEKSPKVKALVRKKKKKTLRKEKKVSAWSM